MFHQGDLQSGIALAVEQAKMVLCFVRDESSTSETWTGVLSNLSEAIKAETVALSLNAGSQEAGFLSSFCPISTVPSIVLIKSGVVQLHLRAEGPASVTPEQLKVQLEGALQKDASTQVSETAPLPSTAVASSIPQAPPTSSTTAVSSESARPTAPSTPSSPQTRPSPRANTAASDTTAQVVLPSDPVSQAPQQSQRADYVKMQKEREQKQRDERERIRQQIKSDREERRRRDELRKHPQQAVDGTGSMSATNATNRSRDIRVQVRTFDGSTLRQTFAPSANIASDLRQWIDSMASQPVPYSLKLIVTPLPNRNIEAAEEEQSLVDLGIRGSCTLVMVPVKGYVESYTGSTPGGLLGSAVSGGYNVVAGTAGAVFGGVRSLLGWNSPAIATEPATGSTGNAPLGDTGQSVPNVRVRTLADQRIEAAKKQDQQFYNGNQLNFQPRKDEGKDD